MSFLGKLWAKVKDWNPSTTKVRLEFAAADYDPEFDDPLEEPEAEKVIEENDLDLKS